MNLRGYGVLLARTD